MKHIVIIGAGIGGLSAACALARSDANITVVEKNNHAGGKIRQSDSQLGPVDIGPTVLTMPDIFETLFQLNGETLEDYVGLIPLKILARHFWDDGATLDLHTNFDTNMSLIQEQFGQQAAQEFYKFDKVSRDLFSCFDQPVMRASSIQPTRLLRPLLRNYHLLPFLAPKMTMSRLTQQMFSSPHLRQLFNRYTTYVGGSPSLSPSILSLIWRAESKGVFCLQNGMASLSSALYQLASKNGVQFKFAQTVLDIQKQPHQKFSLNTSEATMTADAIIFNGDPNALYEGILGNYPRKAIKEKHSHPRSYSALVHGFASQTQGVKLAHHNVFFGHVRDNEFTELENAKIPEDATLYLCAQDLGNDAHEDSCESRFEIIRNAPSQMKTKLNTEEKTRWTNMTMNRFKEFGLTFSTPPSPDQTTCPSMFSQMFPGSKGALYGRSPHGMMAAFMRPATRSTIQGLYLCGGGIHPGAGIPMASLSGQHAAQALQEDLGLT